MAVFDDMEPDRKVTVYDKGPEEPPDGYGDWLTRSGDVVSPDIPAEEPLRLECAHFVSVVLGREDPVPPRANGLAVVRVLEELQASLERETV
jgi:predicted dehydrogenase